MLDWEYPPFKVGSLDTHCYGLIHSLAGKGVSIDFYMPKAIKYVPCIEWIGRNEYKPL